MPPYVPLWCKSNYSFLEGASHPEELLVKAASLGLDSLAVSDLNGVYGMVQAHVHAQKSGIRLIVGSQLTVSGSTLVLLAASREGYARLCSLISLGHHGRPKGEAEVTWEQIAKEQKGLVALWRPEGASHDRQQELDVLKGFDAAYAIAARHRWFGDTRREAETKFWARRGKIPMIAATEVLYHEPGRQELHDVLTCLRHGVSLAGAGTLLKPNAEHALKADIEFRQLYSDEPRWVERTRDIAEQCRFSMSELQYRYPDEKVPEGYDLERWVRHLAFEGAKERYDGTVPEKIREQLEKELDVIISLKYTGYFLTMREIVRYCREHGILCQGRGSAANSALCYCLGVTAIDPLRIDLLFERFLSKERAEPPDIDLDIEHNRREEVIQHMYAKYGRDRAAMVANVVRYRKRSALRDVGQVLGIAEVVLDRTSKLLSHHEDGILGALRDGGLDPKLPLYQRLLNLTQQLRTFPRHLSIHPGGFLLGSEAIARIVPVEPATMEDRTVIQWDKDDIEAMGLFKVDLLGLGALTQLDYAFRLLQQHRHIALSMANIPGDDKAVFAMMSRADTIGVFQIESRAQMSMLPRLKPEKYYDLVVEISIVRPGPISGGMVHPYLKRRSGEEPIQYPHDCLIPVLEKTFGVPLFQEQVMRLAVVAADYTPGEADQLRRDMAAWRYSGHIEQHEQKLISRMMTKGIEKKFAEDVFKQIQGFGEYGFPESHAASFALIAYATAYLKYYHHDIFTCALLNAWPMGFYSPSSIVSDAQRHRVPVLPVDALASDWDCTLEDTGQPLLAVRLGLRYIEGLSRDDANHLISGRAGAASLAALRQRVGLSARAWEVLSVSGAFDNLGVDRRQALWRTSDKAELSVIDTTPFDPHLADLSWAETITWDYEATGLSPRGHLLEEHRTELNRAGYRPAVLVARAQPNFELRYAGLVICRQRPGTAKGVLFMTLEDETGTVNVVVWNSVWLKYRTIILINAFLAVRGKIQSEQGVVHLVADEFWIPEGVFPTGRVPVISYDFH
jgi:error-prone DNA polymerase